MRRRRSRRLVLAVLLAVAAVLLGSTAAGAAAPADSPPADSIGTATVSVDPAFVKALAKQGVVVYAVGQGATTAATLNPLSETLTFPLAPTGGGPGNVNQPFYGHLVFVDLKTHTSVSYTVALFAFLFSYYLDVNGGAPPDSALLTLGSSDGLHYDGGIGLPDLVNDPLGATVVSQGEHFGTITLAFTST